MLITLEKLNPKTTLLIQKCVHYRGKKRRAIMTLSIDLIQERLIFFTTKKGALPWVFPGKKIVEMK